MIWRFDPLIMAAAVIGVAAYGFAVARYGALRRRPWPRERTFCFGCGVASGALAIESPLDAAGDARFAPHMWQHLILTDATAPLVLLRAPLLLVLGVAPTRVARRIVGALKSRAGLWLLHYSGFFEAALDDERMHVLEHAIYFGAALLFWFPVIAIGPTPWASGPLAYPLRMLYLFVAMPAEGMLGFSINGARHVLYPHYAAAGSQISRRRAK